VRVVKQNMMKTSKHGRKKQDYKKDYKTTLLHKAMGRSGAWEPPPAHSPVYSTQAPFLL
jgi:hypothetical protein